VAGWGCGGAVIYLNYCGVFGCGYDGVYASDNGVVVLFHTYSGANARYGTSSNTGSEIQVTLSNVYSNAAGDINAWGGGVSWVSGTSYGTVTPAMDTTGNYGSVSVSS